MKIRKGIFKESLFSALIISYVVIFILSCIVGITIIALSQKQVKDSIYDYNTALVNKMEEMINPIYYDVCEYSKEISNNNDIIEAISRGDLTANDYNYMMPTIKKLDNYRASKEYIHNVFVHCQNSDLIISGSLQNAEQYFRYEPIYNGMDYNKWREFIDKKQYNTFHPVGEVQGDKSGAQILTFVNTLYKKDVKVGTLVIQIDAKEIVSDVLVDEAENNGTSLYILDKKKQPLIVHGYTEGDIEAIPFVESSKNKPKNGDRIIISTIAPENRWMYVSVVPEKVMYRQLLPTKIYFALILMIYIIASVIIMLVALRANNRRLRSVFGKLGVKYNEKKIDVADIMTSIDDLVANNATLVEKVLSKEEYIKRNVLIDILMGRVSGKCEQKLLDAGITFENDLLSVVVIAIKDEGLLHSDTTGEKSLSGICVLNIFSEMLSEFCAYQVATADRNHIAFVLNPEKENGFKDSISKLSSKFRSILSAEFEMSVEIGISTLKSDKEVLNKLYNEALIALDYKTAPGQNAIFYKDITDETEQIAVYYYPFEVEEKLINCVRSGDRENLTEMLDELVERNIRNSQVVRQSKNCFYYDLLGTYIKAANIMGYNIENIRNLYKIDDNYMSVKSGVLVLCEELLDLCEFSKTVRESGVDRTAEEMKKYIDDNYSDVNLGVAAVADQFGLTRQTVSKKFNNAFGIKLNDYITEVRMTKAKELLKTTNLNGFKVAEMVGYVDSSTFIRAFKKIYGITPGQYKKNMM